MSRLKEVSVMRSWFKAFGVALCALIYFNSHAGVGVSTGCRIGGQLGAFTTGVDPCVPFYGFEVDHAVYNSGYQIYGNTAEVTRLEINSAWQDNADIIPSREVVYAAWEAHGNYGTMGVRTGAAFAGTLTNNGYASASSYAQVYFIDTILLRSSNLALGSFVNVNFDYSLDGRGGAAFNTDITNNTYSFLNGVISIGDEFGRYPLSASFCVRTDRAGDCLLVGGGGHSPSFGVTVHSLVSLQIGVEYTFMSSLTAASVAEANLVSGGQGPINLLFGGSSRMDAFNTLNSFLTATSGDYEIVTASGHDYSLIAAVPEPQTYALLLAGLGALGVAVRRRSAAPTL